MRSAIFIDKDGTLINDVPYNIDPSMVSYPAGTMSALRQLQAKDYLLILITNQTGIAKGYYTEEDFACLMSFVSSELNANGIFLDGTYFCPHAASAAGTYDCQCHKPHPGLIRRAAEDHDIDLGTSWMIGDILDDVEAGNRAGCKTILLDAGNETEWELGALRIPDHFVKSLTAASHRILYPNQYFADEPD